MPATAARLPARQLAETGWLAQLGLVTTTTTRLQTRVCFVCRLLLVVQSSSRTSSGPFRCRATDGRRTSAANRTIHLVRGGGICELASMLAFEFVCLVFGPFSGLASVWPLSVCRHTFDNHWRVCSSSPDCKSGRWRRAFRASAVLASDSSGSLLSTAHESLWIQHDLDRVSSPKQTRSMEARWPTSRGDATRGELGTWRLSLAPSEAFKRKWSK